MRAGGGAFHIWKRIQLTYPRVPGTEGFFYHQGDFHETRTVANKWPRSAPSRRPLEEAMGDS